MIEYSDLKIFGEYLFWGNSLITWFYALLIVCLSYFSLRIFLSWVLKALSRLAEKTSSNIDDSIVFSLRSTHKLFFVVLSILLGVQLLQLPQKLSERLSQAFLLLIILQCSVWASKTVGAWAKKTHEESANTTSGQVGAYWAISFGGKLLIWVLTAILVLDNLGINVSTLITGLGIGGIAVALAVQNVLGDVFASLSILLDQPFVVGDFIVVDAHQGQVEHIGLKTTRIRSVSGEQVIISNADLLKSRVRNLKRMSERRVVFQVAVTYQTSRQNLDVAKEIIKAAIARETAVRLDRVHLKELASSSIVFESVFFILSAEYNSYMDIQERINYFVLDEFAKSGIEFAYPTTSVFVKN